MTPTCSRRTTVNTRLLPRTKHANTNHNPAPTSTTHAPTAPTPTTPPTDPAATTPTDTDHHPSNTARPSNSDTYDTDPFNTPPSDTDPFDSRPSDSDPSNRGPYDTDLFDTDPFDSGPFDSDYGPPDWEPADDNHEPVDDPHDAAAADHQAHSDPDAPDHDSHGAHTHADTQAADTYADADVMDELNNGADTTVVIHATGAELRALINGESGTGGETDHHGQIPQNSLRKHLIKALAQTLLPHPTTTSTRQDVTDPQGTASQHATTDHQGTADQHGPATPHDPATPHARSRIDIQLTDEPPASDPDRYTPSAALDRYVRWRDRICQFPGCNRLAEYTDLDHRIAFAAGGRTTADNLQCLCRHHHRLKHEGGWQIHPNPDTSHTWTSPTGRRYRDNTPDPD